jgi:hypothetical protein
MDDPAGRLPHDRDRHAKRVMRRGEVRHLTEPADERLRIARPDANVDAARQVGSIQSSSGGREARRATFVGRRPQRGVAGR